MSRKRYREMKRMKREKKRERGDKWERYINRLTAGEKKIPSPRKRERGNATAEEIFLLLLPHHLAKETEGEREGGGER